MNAVTYHRLQKEERAKRYEEALKLGMSSVEEYDLFMAAEERKARKANAEKVKAMMSTYTNPNQEKATLSLKKV